MSLRGIFLGGAVAASLTAMAVGAEADTTKPVYSPQDAFDEVAAIIEGRVASISYSYDPKAGPRTIAGFTSITTHAGTAITGSLQLATLGGPLPDGRFLEVSELPVFEVDKTYVVFLTAADWFYSPVITDYVFRVERTNGAERMINQTGNPVVGLSQHTIRLHGHSVFVPEVDALGGRTIVPEAGTTLAQGATKAAFIADVVRLHAERVNHLVAQGDPGAFSAKAFKKSPRTDRVWDVTVTTAPELDTGEDELMCIEVDEPPVCQ